MTRVEARTQFLDEVYQPPMTDILSECYDNLASELVSVHERRLDDRRRYEAHLADLASRLEAAQIRFRRALWFIVAEGAAIMFLLALLLLVAGGGGRR